MAIGGNSLELLPPSGQRTKTIKQVELEAGEEVLSTRRPYSQNEQTPI